ncbi:TBC1 domain family member 5 homolog A isoform X2 [Contarinia nasturtii]|uniref:TBC1 domain family member 5 homolog A isoform X2 n=1 Tax=Contarinia nasturtii TaxID=265458 RepID=UPI0012D3FB47|nr:TBC1 domain family member 5 homolog A isoform X2 [Contarinia nasturtii]
MESAIKCDYSNPSKRYESKPSPSKKKSSLSDDSILTEKYALEWKTLSRLSEDPHLVQLRQSAVNGGLKTSKFRSICWSLLLGVLNGRSQSWATQRRCDRSRYVELIKQFYINPRMAAEDDPLSQSDKSVWNQHFCDKELCTVIRQDVVRTFPHIEFFRKPRIQEIMINILFCYARVNPEMCYRQGMHEILAPIIFVMHCDHQALIHVKDISIHGVDELKDVLDPKFLEEDSYFIFTKVMTEIEPFYRIHDLHPTATGYFPSNPQCTTHGDVNNVSDLEVVSKLNMIRDKILAKADSQLHNHLLQLDIPLPLFGIRWLRLLFGREFQLLDLLVLWDAIFAEGAHFELTNFIVVAMLISIREEMLHSDYTTGLSYLMKYPSNIDVLLIIRHSLHMYAPDKYERPPNKFTVSARQQFPNTNSTHLNGKTSSLPRNIHSKKTTQNQVKRVNDDLMHRNQRPNDSNKLSQSPSKSELLKEHAHNIQNSTTKATMRVLNPPQLRNMNDPGIVDGYVENSSEVLKIQLQSAHTVMKISRLKLIQYLAVFRKHIPGDSTHELHQTMDGIEELCELLNVKEKLPYTLPTPVEPAFEANEAAVTPNRKHIDKKTDSNEQMYANLESQSSETETEPPKLVRVPIGSLPPLQISPSRQISPKFNQEYNVNMLYTNFEYIGKADTNSNASAKVRYEIPENRLSRTATLILGNRKELEMHEFSSKLADNQVVGEGSRRQIPEIDPSGDRPSE